ncbi:MAG: hypothetical protein KUG77_15565 [Nannocystaceae bacterium]|nr:hypothetical protein [Nannocystaceae bacterium]
MPPNSDTRWGREFEGISSNKGANEPWNDAATNLKEGRWQDAIQALANCYTKDPTRGVEAMELASCTHLALEEDLRGAVVRARFAVGPVADRTPWDALAEVLSERFVGQDDVPWAALALLDHSQGPLHLAEQVRDGALEERWLTEDGPEALEALVFARADETQDAGWVAISGVLAARDSESAFDEKLVLRATQRHDDANARAWGIEMQVLFSLEHDDAGQNLVAQALDVFGDQPRALLEILDTTNMDVELEPLLHALTEHEPSWVTSRRIVAQAPDTDADGHNPRSLVHALATAMEVSPATFEGGLILPDPPRRTDAD